MRFDKAANVTKPASATMNPEPPLWEARQDAYNIGSHFETIDAAANKARKIGNADTFHWGKAAGYRIRDKRKAVVFEGTFDANRI